MHRPIEETSIQRGTWSHTPTGERAWRMALRSPGAATLRLHVSSYAGGGTLAVYSLRDRTRTVQISEPRDDFWTPLTAGDTALIEYRPHNAAENGLPFEIDRLAHGVIDPWASAKGCDAGDAACQDARWRETRRGVATIEVERDGTPVSCAGWLINTRAGSRKPYLVTGAACAATAEDATTLVAAFGSGFQTAGQRLLATGGGMSLIELDSTPPDAYFLGWTAEGEGEFVAPLALNGAPLASTPGLAAGTRTVDGALAPFTEAYPAFQALLEDAGACEVDLTASGEGFSSQGGNGTAAVRASSPHCQWSAASLAPWIQILAGASARGTGEVAFHVAPNASRQARSGTLAIAGRQVSIRQQGVAGAICAETPIEIGAPVEAEFNNDCLSPLRPGRFSRRFTFRGEKGAPVVIEAESAGFDPYLYLLDQTGRVLTQDDDGGEGVSSRIPAVSGTYKLPYTGTYTLELTASKDPGGGAFRLAACPGIAPIPIAFGQTLAGQLTASSCLKQQYYTQTYSFQGTAGQQVAIAMNSTAVDSYLVLNSPSDTVLLEDDDSGGGLNARVPSAGFYTLPQSGTYVIEASHWDPPFQTGPFTLSLTLAGSGPTPLRFVAVTPCRVMDTRASEGKTGAFGPPAFSASSSRDVPVPSSPCTVSAAAKAYSLNVTVVPRGPLAFLTLWPAGQARPLASTLNSFDGRIVANAAIVPAGPDGSISVFATDATDVIIDINGYFIP